MYKYYANYYEDFAITCEIPENKYTLATEINSDLNIHYIDFDQKRGKWIYKDCYNLEICCSKNTQILKYMMPENWETKNGKFLEIVAIQFNNYMANTFYGINKKLVNYYNSEIRRIIVTLILILKKSTNIQEIIEYILSFVLIKHLKTNSVSLMYL